MKAAALNAGSCSEHLGVCLKCSVNQLYSLLMCMYLCMFFYAGNDFNDTVIVTEVPAAQTLLLHAIEILDDEINEALEVFDVFLEVAGNISNAVQYRIQTTLCRIRQSDRKLYLAKFALHLMMYIHILGLNYYLVSCVVPDESILELLHPFIAKE